MKIVNDLPVGVFPLDCDGRVILVRGDPSYWSVEKRRDACYGSPQFKVDGFKLVEITEGEYKVVEENDGGNSVA